MRYKILNLPINEKHFEYSVPPCVACPPFSLIVSFRVIDLLPCFQQQQQSVGVYNQAASFVLWNPLQVMWWSVTGWKLKHFIPIISNGHHFVSTCAWSRSRFFLGKSCLGYINSNIHLLMYARKNLCIKL